MVSHMQYLVSIMIGVSLLLPNAGYAHGGGLNSAGCHNNRKTGGYHCHRPQQRSSAPQRIKAPIKAVRMPNQQQVQIVQNLLLAMNYDCGLPDGQFGNQTKIAIISFQLDRNLPRTGSVSNLLISELSVALKDGWSRPSN